MLSVLRILSYTTKVKENLYFFSKFVNINYQIVYKKKVFMAEFF